MRVKTKTYKVHRVEAREILGKVPDRTFARLEAEGIIIPSKRGKPGVPSVYDLAVIVPAYVAHLKTAQPANAEKAARARRERSQADLNEQRLAEKQKELIPREQVVREGKAFVLATKAKLLAIPRRMGQAGIVPADKQPEVAALIREALEEMARWDEHLIQLEAKAVGSGE
jgi:hypothetical protein